MSLTYLGRVIAFASGIAIVACGGPDDLVIPNGVLPPPNYDCSNVLDPVGAFQMTYTADFVHTDTSPRTVNAFLLPHRSRDTVKTVAKDGRTLLIIFGGTTDSSRWCVSRFDSLLHHLPNVQKAYVVP